MQEAEMDTSKAISENARAAEDMLRIAALAAAMRVICMDNQIRLRQQCLSVTCPPRPASEIEFAGRVPFGFAFTEGKEAIFRVPSGHRFVIEHLILSPGEEHGTTEVHMVTRSRRMFQHLSLATGADVTTPIVVHGSTENTLLFHNRIEPSSSTVPADTYVQLWGYLEPTEDATSM
jgi:hypothetical protein